MSYRSASLRKVAFVAILLVSFHAFAQAQEEQEPIRARSPIFYEALNLVADDTAKSRVDFNFNIPQTFFVFVRSSSNPSDFIARGEISIEILNAKDVSVARDIIHKELYDSSLRTH